MEDVSKFILPNNGKMVQDELLRMSEASKDEKAEANVWKKKNQTHFKGAGLSFTALAVLAELIDKPWIACIPQRSREVVTFCIRTRKGSCISVDTSQQINRAGKGGNHVTQTLTPNMCTWIMKLPPSAHGEEKGHRVLTSHEALGLQGFPLSWIGVGCPASDPQMKDLAGHAFSADVVGAIYISILALLPASACSSSSESLACIDGLVKLMGD